jgi:hypothetical protein
MLDRNGMVQLNLEVSKLYILAKCLYINLTVSINFGGHYLSFFLRDFFFCPLFKSKPVIYYIYKYYNSHRLVAGSYKSSNCDH